MSLALTDSLESLISPRKAAPQVDPALKVGILVTPDFTLSPLALFTDCLRHAADEADFGRQIYCQWTLLSHTWEAIPSSCGYRVEPQSLLCDPRAYDYIAVVGGPIHSKMGVPAELLEYLRLAHSHGVKLIGLCTGSFVLAEAGLLEGKRCAVHFSLEQVLQKRYPNVRPIEGLPLVRDGDVLTCPGGIAAVEAAREIVLRHCGQSRAQKAIQYLVANGDQFKITTTQLHPLEALALTCTDRRIVQAVTVMRERMYEHLSISALARLIGATEKQLTKAFDQHLKVSPSAFWRELRLDHTHWLVQNTDRSVAQIAYECGFSDSTHFCKSFKKRFSISPAQLRKQHKAMGCI
ncbi:GlxA family transcriptional regulator [Pseudomonas alabamensis]|uniref:GlxA family transcriptional regulator n=1 Tax=Pseudomonas alabamensis TaxID=3064349 RepID=UPI003F651815